MFGLVPWRAKNACVVPSQRRDPFRLMHDEMQTAFDRFFGDWPVFHGDDRGNFPRHWGLDMEESEGAIAIRAELPGFERDEIGVELREDVLTIEATHGKAEDADSEGQSHSHIRRSFTLPSGLDFEKTEAKYRNGVLEIHIPRSPETQSRRIEVSGE